MNIPEFPGIPSTDGFSPNSSAPSGPAAVEKLRDLAECASPLLAAVIEFLPAGFYMGNASGITACNRAGLTLFGFDSLTDLQQNVAGLVDQMQSRNPETGNRMRPEEEPFARALAGESCTVEVSYMHRKTGEEVIVECAAVPLCEHGNVVAALALATNITERKRAEAALRKSRKALEQQSALFETVLSSIVDFAYTFDRDGRFTYANQALANFLQQNVADIIGKNFHELNCPEALAARLQKQIETVFQTGQIVRDETPFTGAAGKTGYYEYIFVPVLGKDGQVETVAGSTRDVTARHREQSERAALLETLENERERLRSLFMQAPSFISVTRGPNHIFEIVNAPYYQLVGHRDLIGKTVREAFPEIEGQGFFELLDEVYRSGKPFVGKEMRILFQEEANGPMRERFLDFVYQPLVEADGSVSGIFAQGIDITERRNAEQALKASQDSLDFAVNGAQLGAFYCEFPLDRIIWNDTCKDHFFLPHDAEIDFDVFYSRLHPDDLERTRQAIEQSIRDQTQYNIEYRVVAPDGRTRWINAIGKTYYTAAGAPYRFDGITIDITEKKVREQTLTFLVELNDATRDLQEPEAIMLTTARMLGRYLNVSRCAYAPVEADENHFTIYADYTNGVPSSAGQYELTVFGPRAVSELRQGRSFIINNRDREAAPGDDFEAFRAIGIQAIVCVALLKEGRLVAMMAVHQAEPRRWTAEEIHLVEMVAERSWAIIERAFADRRLKERAEEIEALNSRLRLAMKETHHRVKNNLQVISAMIEMQLMEYQTGPSVPLEEFTRLQAHVHTLAIAHDLLTTTHKEEEADERISTRAILDKLLPVLQQTAWKQTVRYTVADVELTSKQCVALSLLINELVSNALKHGKSEAEVVFFVGRRRRDADYPRRWPRLPPGLQCAKSGAYGAGAGDESGEHRFARAGAVRSRAGRRRASPRDLPDASAKRLIFRVRKWAGCAGRKFSASGDGNADPFLFCRFGPYHDFDVLIQRCQTFQQAENAETFQAPAQNVRYVRLRQAHQRSGSGLRKAALFHQIFEADRNIRLDETLFGIRQP